MEVVGLDEAYLDLTGLDRHRSAARRVKEAVRAETGLTCSVGIGPNKLVAKVASDAEKPDGFLELTAEGRADPLRRGLARASSPGSARRPSRGSSELGIATLGRLGATPDEQLVHWFGPRLGPHLAALARFEDERAIETVRIAKSESRETTFDRDLHGLRQLEPVLERLTGELCETLAREERRGRTIGIKVRFDDFTHRHAGAQPRRRRERREHGRSGRARPAPAPRSAPAGPAARRPRGRARRGARAGAAGRSAQPVALT